MQQIIDRRLAGKNKSIGNRERFLRRHKEQMREAVKRAVDGRGIRDIEQGEDIHIPKRDISEPVFGHGQGGMREMVHPGNKDYVRGDRIERPKGGGGARQRQGRGQRFRRGRGRFRLPPRARKSSCRSSSTTWPCPTWCARSSPRRPNGRATAPAISSDGTPNNLHVVRSMRGAIGRRIAIGAGSRARAARARRRARTS